MSRAVAGVPLWPVLLLDASIWLLVVGLTGTAAGGVVMAFHAVGKLGKGPRNIKSGVANAFFGIVLLWVPSNYKLLNGLFN